MKYLILLLLISQSHAEVTAFFGNKTTHYGTSRYCSWNGQYREQHQLNNDSNLIGVSLNSNYIGTFSNSHNVQSVFIARKYEYRLSDRVKIGGFVGGVYGYDYEKIGGGCTKPYKSQLLPMLSPSISFELNNLQISAVSLLNAVSLVFEYKFKG